MTPLDHSIATLTERLEFHQKKLKVVVKTWEPEMLKAIEDRITDLEKGIEILNKNNEPGKPTGNI